LNFIGFLTGYDSKFIEPALPDTLHPVTFTLSIEKETDLTTKVIKSKTACVEIPELDIRILPGMNSKDLICDVFGLLSRIQGAIELGQGIEHPKKSELLEKIGRLKEGRFNATLVLTDPSGLSIIMGDAVKEIINT
jgi:zinc finger protein